MVHYLLSHSDEIDCIVDHMQGIKDHYCELAVELLSTSIWDFETTQYLGNCWFFDMVYGTTNIYFWTYNRFTWWTGPAGPAVTLFDALFLTQLDSYRFEIQHDVDIGFKIVVSNFVLKIFFDFGIIQFLLKPVSYIFFHTFLGITQELFNILKTWLLLMEEHQKAILNHCIFLLTNNFIW